MSDTAEQLRSFTFTQHDRTESSDILKKGGHILEPLTPSTPSSSSNFSSNSTTNTTTTRAPSPENIHNQHRKYSIEPGNSVITSLLNAQLNNLKLFDEDHKENHLNEQVIDEDAPVSQTCIEHQLSRLSNCMMTKKQMVQVVKGLRNIESTLSNIKIKSNLTHIMILTKIYDFDEPNKYAFLIVKFLMVYNPEIIIYIQEELIKKEETNHFKYNQLIKEYPEFMDRIKFWSGDKCCYKPETFDLVITLGGDGTVLYASWLFQSTIPPILSFSMGSLGFLTEFDVAKYQDLLTDIFQNGFQCSIRMRFECTLMRSKDRDAVDVDLRDQIKTLRPNSPSHELLETYTVFNELVIDRGPNSSMTALEVFVDHDAITTSEADGLIISTPSGSTAYSLSAGGSLVHPEMPGILISPICPHTLSFRPLVIPETTILRIGVPYDARCTAWCSFDGKNRVELDKGDFITITASRFPLPFINHSKNATLAWFERLSQTLNWNERKRQKPLNMKLPSDSE